MNKKWIGIGAIVLVIVLPLVGKLTGGAKPKEVQLEKVEPRPIKASILASGNLVYREQAQLSPEVIGKVVAILVSEGDKVEKGQLVLRLDEQVFRAEVDQQEANVRQQQIAIEREELNVANQERQWRRTAELHKRKLIDDNQYDDATHALELARVELRASRETLVQAQALLSQAKERLAKTEIRAPISGTVTAIDIKVGETAVASSTGIAGSSLMTIANTDSLMTEVNVDEADIARVYIGQEADIYAAAYPETALKGVVESIPLSPKKADVLSAQSGGSSLARSYSVKVRLDDPEKLQLRPGMTCRAEIFTASVGKTLAVPIQAVFSNNSENADVDSKKKTDIPVESYVFVDKDGIAEKRTVKTGLSDDSYQEITEGLKSGETVVVGPYKILRHLNAGDNLKAGGKAEKNS